MPDVLGIPPCCLVAVLFTLSSRADHASGRKDQRGGPRFTDAHDGGRKSLRPILNVLAPTRDVSQVKVLAVEVGSAHDVLELRHFQAGEWTVEGSLDHGRSHYLPTLVILDELGRALVLDSWPGAFIFNLGNECQLAALLRLRAGRVRGGVPALLS